MPSAPGTHSASAIFLSYAREDLRAATRLAENLRAAGLNVWFDQDALLGGDVWDRAIRKQIRDCQLFVPIISTNTQAQSEGYFRLEWKLAEDRSHLMVKGKPFIVPVCIDDTPERDALVPDVFLSVQWTRLVGPAAGAAFVERLKRLLTGTTTPAPSPAARVASPADPADDDRTRSLAPAKPTEPRIPDYELLRKIGSGSYGDVWLARGLTGVFRAVKIVWRDRFPDAEPYEREFRGLKEFSSLSFESSQMALLHVGQDERAGFFYYVMELADDATTGRTTDPARYVALTAKELKTRRGRLPAAECVTFGVELARSLACLHARQLLHRDIKPSNVIVVAGVPKLADIGLVSSNTEARTYVGTQGYVPPEGPGAPSADVFALGKVLYELATGLDRNEFPKLPENLGDSRERKAFFAFNDVLLRACDPSPAARYRDAAALLADLTALQSGKSVHRPGRGRWVAIAAAAIVVAGAAFFALRPAPKEPAPPARAAASAPKAVASPPETVVKPRGIAVLPFENLDAPDQAYFANGVTAEVTQRLSKVSALRLMSPAAVARFRGGAAELPAMTRDLGIGALLTGTVRRAGDKVRIGVQLLAAPGGETLWSEQYDRDAKDTFAVQTDVAVAVVRALQISLPAKERMRIMRTPTENLEAYELYLTSGRKGFDEAIGMLQRAVTLDPKFAAAYSVMSRRYLFKGFTTGRADHNRALELARQAVAADSQSAGSQHALATALATLGQHEESRGAFQLAVEIDAASFAGMNDFSVLEMSAGRLDQSVYWAKRAFQQSPNLANSYYHLSVPWMLLDDRAAERFLKSGEARFPVTHPTRGDRIQHNLAALEVRRGQMEAAVQRMRNAVEAQPQNRESVATLTDFAFLAGTPDAAELVEKAMQKGPGARVAYSGYTARTMRAFLWFKSGDRDRAQPLIEAALVENNAAIKAGDRSAYPLYENAALELMRGDRAAALTALEAATQAGFTDAAFLRIDPLLTPLATEPRFTQLLERIERDLSAMRKRIDMREIEEWIAGGSK